MIEMKREDIDSCILNLLFGGGTRVYHQTQESRDTTGIKEYGTLGIDRSLRWTVGVSPLKIWLVIILLI